MRMRAAVALLVLGVAGALAPAGSARPLELAAAEAAATATIPVPSAGDLTVARITIQAKRGKAISPKLAVLRGAFLGPDVSVFAGLRPVKGRKGRYEGIVLVVRTPPAPSGRPAPRTRLSDTSVTLGTRTVRGSAAVSVTIQRDVYRAGTFWSACGGIRPDFIEKPLKVSGLFGPLTEGDGLGFASTQILIKTCDIDPGLGSLVLGPNQPIATYWDDHVRAGLTFTGATVEAASESVVSATITGPPGAFANTTAGQVERSFMIMRVFDDAGTPAGGLPVSAACLSQPIQQFSPYRFALTVTSFGRKAQLSSTFVVDQIERPDPRCAPGSPTAPGPATSGWWCTYPGGGYVGLDVHGTPGGRFQTTIDTNSPAALDGADFATAAATFSLEGERYLGAHYVGPPRTFAAQVQLVNPDSSTNGITSVTIDTSKPSPEPPPTGSPCYETM